MDFSANIDFTADELVAFLEELTLNLRQSRNLELPLGFTHVTMNVGDAKIKANFEVTEEDGKNMLNMRFDWEEVRSIQAEEIVEVSAKSAEVVSATDQEQFIEEPAQVAKPAAEAPIAVEVAPTAAIKTRMRLNTTTFSSDVGSYLDAYAEAQSSHWELLIDRDAQPANLKWAQDTQILDGIPQIPVRSQKTASFAKTDKKSDKKSKAYITEIAEIKAPETSVPAPSINKSTKSPPPPSSAAPKSSVPQTSAAPAPPARSRPPLSKEVPRERIDTQTTEWHEPSRDDISTGDDWVKPSEILKKKQKEPISHVDHQNPVIPPPKNPDIIEEGPGFKPSDIAKLAGTADNSIPSPVTEDRGRPDVPSGKKKKKKSGWADW